MRAVVLAAGEGRRMLPLTAARHKSLLAVGGDPLLRRIVDGLLDLGVSEIVVVTGHRREEVAGFLAEHHPQAPIRLLHNPRYRETNNIVSLSLALDALAATTEDVVLVECDVLFDPSVLRLLAGAERGNLALVDRYRPGMDGTVVSVENGVVTQVFPPHLQTNDFDYRDKFKTVNIYRFAAQFCRETFQPLLSCYANVIDSGCYYELVLGMLINMQHQPVRAVEVNRGQWAEVDDPNDLAAARFVFEPAARTEILSEVKGGFWNFDVLDFSFMRNMYFPTEAMLAGMRRALPALLTNYGSAQSALEQKLAYALGCRPQRLLCLNGAAQAYPWLGAMFARQRVLLPEITFNEYPRWLPQHVTYRQLPHEASDFDLVIVVNPNNPGGEWLATDALFEMAARQPATTFLVDESFLPFSSEPSLLPRLEAEALDNVVVLASLSKAWGVPGIRLGYAYGSGAIIASWRSQVPIWNSNSVAEFFLELVLKFQPELAASLQQTRRDREALREALGALDMVQEVFPSGGDYLLLRLRRPAAAVVEVLLRRHAIYIKDVSSKFPPPAEYVRVAVRTPEDHQRLLAALAEL